jgi:ferredoxin--NADP+ reductase
MNEIINRSVLVGGDSPTILIEISSPRIAHSALPGQFVVLRTHERGERIPLTIAEANAEQGTITLIFQAIGAATIALAALSVGDSIRDLAGPLGAPTELDGYEGKRAAVIGGGLGCAIAYPQARWLHGHGAHVDIIAGFRTADLIIIEEQMKAVCENLILCTDDGSRGTKGFVTDALKGRIDSGIKYDLVIAIGPPIMMKFVSALTKNYAIKTIVSLNPIMIDGTGMCGCCRVTIDGVTRFACVDGPDFDGHLVDFDELIRRNNQYREGERRAREASCNLLKKADSEVQNG